MNFGTKLAYGAGDVGGAIVGILLLLVVRVWDAFLDPVIGIMSDRGNVFGAKISRSSRG